MVDGDGNHENANTEKREYVLKHEKKRKSHRGSIHATSTIKATMQPNYRRHHYHCSKPLRSHSYPCKEANMNILMMNKTLSIEIKPKAGYRPYSPLIQPQNRAKFFHTRFEILQ